MFNGEERRDLVMLEVYFALRVDNKADIEIAIRYFWMVRLRLGHNEGIVRLRYLSQCLCLFTGDVDGTFTGKLDVIEVKHFIVEALQSTFGESDQANRQIKTGEPGSSLDEMGEMIQIAFDIGTCANASHSGDESDGSVGLNHGNSFVVSETTIPTETG